MASEPGRGAQVRLDGDARALARGAIYASVEANQSALRELERAGTVADGYTVDGSTSTGIPASDELLDVGGSLKNLVFAAVTTSVQTPTDTQMFQRTTITGGLHGKGTGSVHLQVTLSAPAFAIEFRTRDAEVAGNPVLQNWTVGAFGADGGTNDINLFGVSARLGWFYIDVRANGDNGSIAMGSTRIGMGRITALAGQSLALRSMGKSGDAATLASAGIVIDPHCTVYAPLTDFQRALNPPLWATPADGGNYDAGMVAEYLRRDVAAYGVNCGVIGHAVGSTAIATWLPGQPNNLALHQVLAQAGGAWEVLIWLQGHSDARAGTTGSTYRAGLTSLIPNIQAANGFTGAKVLIASIPNVATDAWGDTGRISIIRGASAQWAAENGAVAVEPQDLHLVDGTHQGVVGGVALARHFHRAAKPAGDIGPSLVSATRATGSAVIVLTLTQAAGTALVAVGSIKNRFAVYTDFGLASPLTISTATIVSPTRIDLTLSAAPADSVTCLVVPYFVPELANDGGANVLYDNNAADGFTVGRHLRPIYTPIIAAAPDGSPIPGPPLDMTDATYNVTGKFGSSLSGGIGTGSASTLPDDFPMTVECWIKMATVTSGTMAAVGVRGAVLLGMTQSKAYATYGNSAATVTMPTAITIVADTWYHLRLVLTADGATFSVNGVVAASSEISMQDAGFVLSGTFYLRQFSPAANLFTGEVDEVAVWATALPATFTPPVAAYTGFEAGKRFIFHLDGSGGSV